MAYKENQMVVWCMGSYSTRWESIYTALDFSSLCGTAVTQLMEYDPTHHTIIWFSLSINVLTMFLDISSLILSISINVNLHVYDEHNTTVNTPCYINFDDFEIDILSLWHLLILKDKRYMPVAFVLFELATNLCHLADWTVANGQT